MARFPSSCGSSVTREQLFVLLAAAMGAVIGVTLMFCAFGLYGEVPSDPAIWHRLTDRGRLWYKPERELSIYAVGCALTIGLALSLQFLGRRRMACPASAVRLRQLWVLAVPVIGLVIATGVMMAVSKNWRGAAPSAITDIALLALIASIGLAVFVRSLRLFAAPAEPVADAPRSGRTDTGRQPRFNRWDVVVASLLILLIYIPDTYRAASRIVELDWFHHWDFFVMAPALGFAQGGALGTNIYSQYGVAWPVLFGALAPLIPLSYGHIFQAFVVIGCLYFILLYLFLRNVFRSVGWAAGVTFAALFFNLFMGNGHNVLWVWPSSTILRSVFDIALLMMLWLHLKSGKDRYFFFGAALLAFAILFETDTGAYLCVPFVACWAIFSIRRVRQDHAPIPHQVARAVLAGVIALAIVLMGLAIASRGTLWQPGFFAGWIEALTSYADGVSMELVFSQPTNLIVSMSTVAIYLFAISYGAVRCSTGRASPLCELLLLVSLYGLCYFCQFIGRSAGPNLFHESIPLVIVVGILLHKATRVLMSASPAEKPYTGMLWTGRIVIVAVFIAAYAANPGFRLYPGLIRTVFTNDAQPGDRPLNPSINDVILPASAAKDIDDFGAVVAEIRTQRRRGRDVAIISVNDTSVYLATGTPLRFRYSPSLALVLQSQLRPWIELIDKAGPDFAFVGWGKGFVSEDPNLDNTPAQLIEALRRRYTLQHRTGTYDVWQRNESLSTDLGAVTD